MDLGQYGHAQGKALGFRDILSRFGGLDPPRCRDDVEEVPGNPRACLGPAFVDQEAVAVAFHAGREGNAGQNTKDCLARFIDRDSPLIDLFTQIGVVDERRLFHVGHRHRP